MKLQRSFRTSKFGKWAEKYHNSPLTSFSFRVELDSTVVSQHNVCDGGYSCSLLSANQETLTEAINYPITTFSNLTDLLQSSQTLNIEDTQIISNFFSILKFRIVKNCR